MGSLKQRLTRLMEWWGATRPGRTLQRYGDSRAALLARGMAYSAIFSVFAGLFVFFAVFGIWFESSPSLRDSVIDFLAATVPGLIDTGSGGALDPEQLFNVQVLGISGVIVIVVLSMTASGWLQSFRDAVRTIFGIGRPERSFLLLRTIDLAGILAIGILVIASAVLSVLSTRVLGMLVSLFELDDSLIVSWVLNLIALGAAFLIDVLTLFLLFRVLTVVPVATRQLLLACAAGAIGFGALKYLGATLASGGGNNPLLTGFAVIIGLLVWFNLVMQLLLWVSAWLATGPRTDTPGTAAEAASGKDAGSMDAAAAAAPQGTGVS